MIDPSFWAGRNVFLTGHTGFKGSWLALWLSSLGAKVTGYALEPPSNPALFEIANVERCLVKNIRADIRDQPMLNIAMQGAEPDIVIHMAAQSLVRESYADPNGTYSTNVMGTVCVLEAVRANPSVQAMLNVTSDKCYENDERKEAYREGAAMGGHDPYSSSKGCSELITSAYRRSFLDAANVAIASARAGNVIGGGDWAKDRIVPDAVRAFIADQTFQVRNPGAVRPWQHVLDPLAGYLVLCQHLVNNPARYSASWNFGPADEDAKPVSDIADSIVRIWGENAAWQPDNGDHPHEARYLRLDCKKAREELNWIPAWRLERALEETVRWYKSWYSQLDMHIFTLRQIEDYQGELSSA